ncbi:MAG: SDR family oxidoreductase [Puia sp.]
MQLPRLALLGLQKSIAHELGSRNIRCNAIAPVLLKQI